MSEEKPVLEPREAYVTEVPLYYDRFLEERDGRIAAELHGLRTLIEVNDRRIGAELHELRSLIEINAQQIEELQQQVTDLHAALVREPAKTRGKYFHSSDRAWEERLRIESRIDNLSRWVIFLLTIALFGALLLVFHPYFRLP